MSTRRKRNKKTSSPRKPRRSTAFVVALVLIFCCVVVAAVVHGPGQRSRVLSWFSAPPPPPPPSLAKEYVYAGGKLVATEEPGAPLSPPANVIADTSSATQIDITWNLSAGADHYQVERANNLNGTFTVLNSNVTTTSYSDTTVSSINAYIYRVRAANSSGGVSQYGNVDIATAIAFTDASLVAGSTFVKATHITELRQAVDAMRLATNLPAVTWTDASLANVPIKAVHVTELRTNLDGALIAVGITPGAYTDTSLSGVEIKKVHIDELRQRVR